MSLSRCPAGDCLLQSRRFVRTFRHEGVPVLELTLRLPRLSGDGAGVRRVERYYARLYDRLQAAAEGPLFRRAREAVLGQEPPGRPWRAAVSYTVTLQAPGLLSLFWEVSGLAEGPFLRRYGDTWAFPAGTPLSLRSCLPEGRRWRQVRRDLMEAHPEVPAHALRPRQFYLTEEGLVLFQNPPPGGGGVLTLPLRAKKEQVPGTGPDTRC